MLPYTLNPFSPFQPLSSTPEIVKLTPTFGPAVKRSADGPGAKAETAIFGWTNRIEDEPRFISVRCRKMHARPDTERRTVNRLTHFRDIPLRVSAAHRVKRGPPGYTRIDRFQLGIKPHRRSNTASGTGVSERRRLGAGRAHQRPDCKGQQARASGASHFYLLELGNRRHECRQAKPQFLPYHPSFITVGQLPYETRFAFAAARICRRIAGYHLT